MEAMYQQYRDRVEFRMVYINEAHAADSNWAVGYAREKGINNHTSYDERCQTAEMLIADKSLTIPCLIDGMDNRVNQAYRAWPDRVFLVRRDGRLAVAATRGPRGFAPALKQVDTWLREFKKTGREPELTDAQITAAEKRAAEKAAGTSSKRQDDNRLP